MEKEIILTDKNNITSNGKKFPKTPSLFNVWSERIFR